MQTYEVPVIYIVEDMIKTEEQKRRLDRMLKKIKSKTVVRLSNEELKGMMVDGWYVKGKTGMKKTGNPSIIFSSFDWNNPINNPLNLKNCSAFNSGAFAFADFRDNVQLREAKGVVCNSAYEIHSAFGCFHSCDYCHIGNAYSIMLDVEEFVGKVDELSRFNPWQKLYKYDNQTDILLLEPEYGASKKLVEHFSKTDNYLMLYTKSDNVDHLLELEHKGRTIVCFTLSSHLSASNFENGAPSLFNRILAAKKCQSAGYLIRVRFSPIVPIRGWKEEASKLIEMTMANLKPDVISLEMLCHMDYETMCKTMDTGLFDKRFLRFTGGNEYELFPHELREEVYKFYIQEIRQWNKDVNLALCLETPKMWKSLKGWLDGDQYNFKCCCGGKCVP